MSASQFEAIQLTSKQSRILVDLQNESTERTPAERTPIARRASLILEIAKGNRPNSRIAKELGVSYAMVKTWRKRWAASQAELLAVEEAGSPESRLRARIESVLSARASGYSRYPLLDESTSEDVLSPADNSEHQRVDPTITAQLRQQILQLEQENQDLNLMLETLTEHSDLLSDELHQEKEDLEFMLEMTTEHSDAVSEELQEKAEEALRESERKLRLIVQATPVPVIIARIADQEVQYANHMAGPLLGLKDEEVTGCKLIDFFNNKDDWDTLVDELNDSSAVDEFEMQLMHSEERQVWVTVAMRPIEFNDVPSILAAFHDITERKKGEIQLQEQVIKLRNQLDEARHSSIAAEQSGTAFFTNMDTMDIKHNGVRLVAVHSFRGGTGKSFITANVAALLATSGQRVGIVDTSLQSPGIHLFFGVEGQNVEYALNDILWEKCRIQDAVHDVTDHLDMDVSGKVFLIPSSINPGYMAQIVSQGYPASQFTESIHQLAIELGLDVLLIDTHPGLNEEALLALGEADAVVMVMRPEHQDYEGTGVAIQIARKLQIPSLSLVVNQVPAGYDSAAVHARAEQAFDSPVAAVLPYAPEVLTFDGGGLFALHYPAHSLSIALQRITASIVGDRAPQPIHGQASDYSAPIARQAAHRLPPSVQQSAVDIDQASPVAERPELT